MSIDRLGVVGAGVMGSEIAYAAAEAGIDVLLHDVRRELIDAGIEHATSIAGRRVAKGRMDPEVAEAVLGRIAPAESPSDLASCGLVIEAVTEVIDIKLAVFSTLDAATPASTILASNTSGLSITTLAESTRRPERVLGLHFFNPASVMPLVEVIAGSTTSRETVAESSDLVRRLGKTPVEVAECPGFLVNRVLVRALAEAYRAAPTSEAALAAADAAVVQGGPAPMGAFALGDLIGLDTLAHVQRDLEEAYGERFADGGRLAALVAQGRLGRKSGGGFFSAPPVDAPVDDDARGVADRYYAGALDEARRCMDEGVARSREDLDLALRLGAGWALGPLEQDAGGGEPA